MLIVVLAAYGALIFLTKSASSTSASETAEQAAIKQEVINSPEYPTFLAHQDKLKNLDLLLKNHLSWCTILPNFAQNTVKETKYTKFTANADGSTAITGTVPDFATLAKMIQAFQLNNGKFIKDVKLVNVGLSDGEKNEITYTINVTFNKSVLNNTPDTCS